MKLNLSKEWIERIADLEDGCEISAGGYEYFDLIPRVCKKCNINPSVTIGGWCKECSDSWKPITGENYYSNPRQG